MKIIANHAHLMPPESMASGWPAGDAEKLLGHLDFCGIEQAVIFPPFACQFQGSMKNANLWALQECRKHPDRFIPAGTLFPLAADILEVLRLLHDQGVRLAKVHPSIDLHDIADPMAQVCYAKAAELGIALDYHTGPHGTRLSLAAPTKFDDLAWNYPELILIFEHLGGRTFYEQFLAILSNHRQGRIFGGLTSVLSQETHKLWCLGAERIVELVQCVGAGKLIYGLDFPWQSAETNKRDIEIILSLDIPAEAKKMILGGSLAALLGRKKS